MEINRLNRANSLAVSNVRRVGVGTPYSSKCEIALTMENDPQTQQQHRPVRGWLNRVCPSDHSEMSQIDSAIGLTVNEPPFIIEPPTQLSHQEEK
jgi:hypothetical protein